MVNIRTGPEPGRPCPGGFGHLESVPARGALSPQAPFLTPREPLSPLFDVTDASCALLDRKHVLDTKAPTISHGHPRSRAVFPSSTYMALHRPVFLPASATLQHLLPYGSTIRFWEWTARLKKAEYRHLLIPHHVVQRANCSKVRIFWFSASSLQVAPVRVGCHNKTPLSGMGSTATHLKPPSNGKPQLYGATQSTGNTHPESAKPNYARPTD